MRAKELKAVINKMPDDAEILIRAQIYEQNELQRPGYINVDSISHIVDASNQKVILNPQRDLRCVTWQPHKKELVDCSQCKNGNKIRSCKSKNRVCGYCEITCKCKLCDTSNIDLPVPFEKRLMWEKKVDKK